MENSPRQPAIPCDKHEFLRFFAIVAPGEAITFQTFADDKAKASAALASHPHGQPALMFDRLEALNERGAGIFWMVNRGDGKGRATANVQAVRHAFVDLDEAPIEPVEQAAVRPSLIVESSPGRYHGYWLNIDCPLEHFTAMQIGLARLFNGDETVSDLPRVLRVPGFLHKKAKPFMTHIWRAGK